MKKPHLFKFRVLKHRSGIKYSYHYCATFKTALKWATSDGMTTPGATDSWSTVPYSAVIEAALKDAGYNVWEKVAKVDVDGVHMVDLDKWPAFKDARKVRDQAQQTMIDMEEQWLLWRAEEVPA